MHSRLLRPILAAAIWLVFVVLSMSSSAGASDGSGGYTSTNDGASAGGGQVTVQAGMAAWMSAGSPASESGSSGTPNSDPAYECTSTVADSSIQQFLGPGGTTPGEWVIYTCPNTTIAGDLPLEWVPVGQAQAPVDPAALAEQAVSKLGLASPTIEMSPPAGSPQLVGVATWMWIDPSAWRTLTASASAGPVTSTATAMPSKVVWNMGDGDTVTCNGPGTPFSPSDPNASTDCSYTWPQAGSYTVTATMYWSVIWTATGAPGGGNLGVQAGPPAEVQVVATESQAINTPSGGSD